MEWKKNQNCKFIKVFNVKDAWTCTVVRWPIPVAHSGCWHCSQVDMTYLVQKFKICWKFLKFFSKNFCPLGYLYISIYGVLTIRAELRPEQLFLRSSDVIELLRLRNELALKINSKWRQIQFNYQNPRPAKFSEKKLKTLWKLWKTIGPLNFWKNWLRVTYWRPG